MTSNDIINHLDPDKLYCIFLDKWIKLSDRCKWHDFHNMVNIEENNQCWWNEKEQCWLEKES